MTQVAHKEKQLPALYRVLDVGLSLESDSPELLGLVQRDYAWFAASTIGAHARPLAVSLRKNVLRVNELAWSLEDHPAPVAYAHQTIIRLLRREIKAYHLLHAAVVAKGEEALVFCGPPGVGKTTLTLRLLEHGFRFLSDDYCPIHRETHLVHPFPRSMWISTSSQLGGHRGSSTAQKRGYKIPLPPFAVAEKPCRPKCLICLDPGNGWAPWHEFHLGLKQGGEESVIRALGGLKDVLIERIHAELSEWRIQYPSSQGLTRRVREILFQYQHYVWNVYRVDAVRPDFRTAPVLAAIPSYEAALFVLSELKQEEALGYGGEPIGAKPGGYLMELSKLFSGVSCYRLTTGELDALTDLTLSVSD